MKLPNHKWLLLSLSLLLAAATSAWARAHQRLLEPRAGRPLAVV